MKDGKGKTGMRGFLGGVSIGALVAAAGAAMLSLSVPLPKVVDVAVDTPTSQVAPADAANLQVQATGPDADLVEAAPTAPESVVSDDLSALQDADTQPADRPNIGSDESALTDPLAVGDAAQTAPQITLQTDAPVIPIETLPAPSAPSQEAEIVVSSEPAQPPKPIAVPAVPTVDIGAAAPTSVTEITTGTDEAVPTDRGTDLSISEETVGTPQLAGTEVVGAPQVAIDVPTMTAPDPTQAPLSSLPTTLPSVVEAPAQQSVPGEASEDPVQETVETVETDTADERIAALPTTTTTTPERGTTIGTPVVPLTERNSDQGSTEASGPSPFEAYSVPFENPEERPLMSIVLIDDAQSIGAEALLGFPYPLSFAIDPEDPKAAEKMEARRAAGFEVLVLTDLPREAAPQDAETALAVWFDTLPEAIGVLEGTDTGFQGNRPLADQVSAAVAATGRGLLTQDHGLNTVQKLAARDGVPAAVVFRDFDGAGQNPRAIRRFLDQAAFRAGQEGAVVMLGRVRPDTISALLLWGLQDRASKVSLAPVSAALSLNAAEN